MVTASIPVKLDKKDYKRALLTDTAPSDTPIIFSNEGFYINAHIASIGNNRNRLHELIASIFNDLIAPGKPKTRTKPYKYKIRKTDFKARVLSLLHPRAQNNIAEFYRDWSNLIVYYCSRSPCSIRAPEKVANSFYQRCVDQSPFYKEINIDTLEAEIWRKYASSFFAYKGIDRLYKFYSSQSYLDLEKQYPVLWEIDIANCFPSIYTHSIAWAVKSKEFIKSHVEFSNQFSQEFDRLFQRTNDNETNGIPVGAEASRIFAEVILQAIDLDLIGQLELGHSLSFGSDYFIQRYVDDYLLFARDHKVAQLITAELSDLLFEYNLHINENKLNRRERPFVTKTSITLGSVNEVVKHLEDQLFYRKEGSSRKLIYAREIRYTHKFSRSIINRLKGICGGTASGYENMSPFLIGVLGKRVERLVTSIQEYRELEIDEQALPSRNAIVVLLEIMFFFYSVHSTTSGSNLLARTIVLVDELINNKLPAHGPYVREEIMGFVKNLSLNETTVEDRNGYISLERLNIILATTNFGDNFLVPAKHFEALFKPRADLSYFNVVSLLYYFRDRQPYRELASKLEAYLQTKLESHFDPWKCSESAHIFLDILCCPFVRKATRMRFLDRFYKTKENAVVKTEQDLADEVTLLEGTYWFVNWSSVNLLKRIERKKLKIAY